MTGLWALVSAAAIGVAAATCPPGAIPLLIAVGATLYITGGHPVWLLAAAIGLAVPSAWARRGRRLRQQRIESDLPLFCDQLASGLKAGLSIESAWQSAADGSTGPIRPLLDAVRNRLTLGTALADALAREVEGMASRPLDRLVRIFELSRDSGLDLGRLLATLAVDIREDSLAEERIRALSAQGRLQAAVLALMPVLLLTLLAVIEPARVAAFVHDPRGQLMLAAVVVLEGLGLLWIRRLVRI